jgi:hypothetical protein
MTPEAFRTRLRALGLSLGAFARLTGYDATTVSFWGRARGGKTYPVPAWIPLLLDAWDVAGVPK